MVLLHSIGRFDGPGATNSWITKYIFPGGYSPALSEKLGPLERPGCGATDIEILRLHYAMTLRALAPPVRRQPRHHRRFVRRALLPDVRVLPFRFGTLLPPVGSVNFQIQMVRDQNAVPLARDYMFETERAANRLAAAAE